MQIFKLRGVANSLGVRVSKKMNTQRPLNITIAAILLEVFSALNLVSPLILGASDEVPAFVGCLHVALGVAGLVASAGLWILKK